MAVVRCTAPILLVALLLAAGCPAALAADVNARQLLDHLYQVSGQLPIQTLIVEMDASSAMRPEKNAPSNLVPSSHDKIFFKKPNKLRVDSIQHDPGGPMDGKQLTIIRDGANRWMFVSMGEYPVKKGADEPSPTLLLPYHIQIYPQQDSNKQYQYLGVDKGFGRNSSVVRILDPTEPKAAVTVWIDTLHWVPLCLDVVKPSAKQGEPDVKKRVLYKDIRRLPDGRYFPYLLEIYVNGVLNEACVYKAVGVNEKVPDSLFEPMSRFVK